ncbi:MAG: AAA family ATPase [Candidatus Nomurabacteria bacterium]|jgi:ATP-dependent Clp protease ATP-binding subunit ClpC|nr:AAA family ATPase [Candidatus Nomurabacteria bacterium]
MDYLFDFNDKRAKKARFYVRFGKTIKVLMIILILLFGLGGIGLVVLGQKIGWLLVSFALSFWSVLTWLDGDLKNPATVTGTVSGMIDPDLLGRLPLNPSPKDIALQLQSTYGGGFFSARFGVPTSSLENLVSSEAGDSATVWAKASEIYSSLPERDDFISSTTIMAALILTQPQVTGILPQLHLDEDDILAGCMWGAHIDHVLHEHEKVKMTGGIGRDWAFGYTPLLEHFGVNISEKYSAGRGLNVELETHRELIDAMLRNFDNGGGGNVALIGPLGSGKTSVVEAFAEKLMDTEAQIPQGLRFQQVFELDASALLSVAARFGGMENLMNRILNEVYSSKNIILFLDSAELFFENGTGSIDISNILLPVLENSAIRVILAMNEQRYLQISQRNTALAGALNRLNVTSSNEKETMLVLQDQLLFAENKKTTFTYQAIKEIYRLSDRYIKESAQPGAAVQLLKSVAKIGGLITPVEVQKTIEQTIGVKVGVSNDAAERETLLNLEDQIHSRMINQKSAVEAVASSLRRARAGVRNENRPIGTFLFLGPTGVGKTELAKSLAAVYFGGENHMVRIDLNEYVKTDDVRRLIADGADNPNSLTAQVLKNPFSVVLLDEIEKASDSVLTTLLQVLDEGILRDENNREISFRDAIIIATSNAGANRIRQLIDAGEAIEKMQETIVNELIDAGEFKPEFLNRFDEIAVFRPLNKEELLQILDLIIAGVNKNLNLQKVQISVDTDAKTALVDAGYDPRLGARPMRRIVQNTIENIVAKKTLAGEIQPGETLNITLPNVQEALGAKNAQ